MIIVAIISEIWTALTRLRLRLHFLTSGHTNIPNFRQIHGYSTCPICHQTFGYY